MASNPYVQSPYYTAIAIAYNKQKCIADMVLPYVPVAKREFRWLLHNYADGITVPNTRIGRKSSPNKVVWSATEQSGFCEDFGLEIDIPQDDINNAPPGVDVRGKSVELTMNLVMLDRERRVSDLVFNTASYAPGNVLTLAGGDQFDKVTSDPQGVIDQIMEGSIQGYNKMVTSRKVLRALRRNPQIVQSIRGQAYQNAASVGKVTTPELAEFFEVDEILVGEAWFNGSRAGQNVVNRFRAWGNHIAFMSTDTAADATSGTTFGFTARFGDRVAKEKPGEMGLDDGVTMKTGEKVREVISAPDLGFYIQNAIA